MTVSVEASKVSVLSGKKFDVAVTENLPSSAAAEKLAAQVMQLTVSINAISKLTIFFVILEFLLFF